MLMSEHQPDDQDDALEWEFEPDNIVREEIPQPAPEPGVSERDKKEYLIKRRLIDADTGERLYKVETEEDGTHIYAVKVLHLNYEEIDEEESRVWPKENGGGMFD